jgi:type IV pilus assembly protein PilO
MKLSDKDKKLLVLLILIGILAFAYFYIYTPFIAKLNALREEVKKLETDYDTLQGKSVQKTRMDSQMKFIRYEMDKLSTVLPADILQDNMIIVIKDLMETTGVELNNLSFSEVVPIDVDSSQKEVELTLQQKLVKEMLPEDAQEKDKKSENENKKIKDNVGISAEVRAQFSADYDQMKDFLAKVMDFEQKIIVSDITFSQDAQHVLSGSLKLTFHGFKDSTREVPGWDSDIERGKNNIFEPYEGYIRLNADHLQYQENSDKNNEKFADQTASYGQNAFDLYAILNPITDDAPAVIIGKSKQIGSEIYSDGNKFLDVEIRIEQSQEKYVYRYKTNEMSYPKDYNTVQEFKPFDKDVIVLRIISKKRINPQDMAGANINIYNNTGKKLVIKMNKEEWEPRANISVKKGAFAIERE